MLKENFRILIVDDEEPFLKLLTNILSDENYTVKGLTDPIDALRLIEGFSPNLIITDMKMPHMDGIRFMEEIRKNRLDIDFIVITAFATVEDAVKAMKMGASDYITKPLKSPEQLRIVVSKIYEKQRLISENILLKSEIFGDMPPLNVIFAGIENILEDIKAVAPTDATVMIYGETGTGKSLIAKVIHKLSKRTGPFVDINCAAIPESLLESELFGYEKGAFTGAQSMKKGKFELANDGTIFLDEISEMRLEIQAKFLKVLQERIFSRLGSLNDIKTNARVIAATNRNLKELVGEKKFREDLYYRLNVFPITIPPLRERKGHIPEIAKYLIKTISARLGKDIKEISNEDMERLSKYEWTGNIRELENVIERAIILSKSGRIEIPPLEPIISDSRKLEGDLKMIEMSAIENALKRTNGNRRKAAEILGISLRALQYKIKEYGIK